MRERHGTDECKFHKFPAFLAKGALLVSNAAQNAAGVKPLAQRAWHYAQRAAAV
ncbi:MAG: hypothetical protein HY243_10110 [Proteobacteria bacterium]|nr:hypothetical protein [Pseudomonadota bacterium]